MPKTNRSLDTFYNTLLKAGMCRSSAEAKADLFGICLEYFSIQHSAVTRLPVFEGFVPGRIELVGKHTDYAGGRSLVTAIDLGFNSVVRTRADSTVRIRDVLLHETFEFDLANLPESGDHPWSNYPLTVARRLTLNFKGPLRGADIALFSDLPPASGLSSSSAFTIAIYMAIAAVNKLDQRENYRKSIRGTESLAEYLACIENGESYGELEGERGVGTSGGSEDHTAILCSRPGCAIQYRYRPTVRERVVRIPPGVVFVVAVSGIMADKNSPETRERFNRKSRITGKLAELWRNVTGRNEPHLAAVLDSGPGAAAALGEIVRRAPEGEFQHRELLNRLRQFEVENNEIVPQTAAALERGDFAALGPLLDRSQHMAEIWLENQVPETIFLARSARELGAHAASSFGAGFGGAVWALVDADRADEFRTAWQARYRAKFPEAAVSSVFRACESGPAAFTFPLNF